MREIDGLVKNVGFKSRISSEIWVNASMLQVFMISRLENRNNLGYR